MSLGRQSPNFAPVNDSRSGSIPTPYMNGRVDILSKPSTLSIPSYAPQRMDNTTFCNEALNGNWEKTTLSQIFFSVDNIEALQQGIRGIVYQKSGTVIGRQSDQELKIIMKAIYLQNAKHDPTRSELEQVRELNSLVLNYSVNQILTNLVQFKQFQKDISTLPVPMEHSKMVTNKGTKTLEIKSFF